jgi:hypothetical protein
LEVRADIPDICSIKLINRKINKSLIHTLKELKKIKSSNQIITTIMKTSCCHSKEFQTTENGVICLNTDCENYLATTGIYKEYGKIRSVVVATVFGFLMLFSMEDFSMENKSVKPMRLPDAEMPLTAENLRQELIDQEVLCPDQVLAQIKLESGNLSSFLLKRTNNMLGMRYPGVRKTTACGVYIPSMDTVIVGNREDVRKYLKMNNYAVYKSWKDAVADYKLWQQSNFDVTENYLAFLGKVYAEDANYIKKIKQVAERN